MYIGMRFHLYIFFTMFCVHSFFAFVFFFIMLIWSPTVVSQHLSKSDKRAWLTRWPPRSFANPIWQRSPNVLDAGPNSRSYQCLRAGLYCVSKTKQKKNTTRIAFTFVFFYFFLCSLTSMFAMWFMNLLLLLHNSCRLITGSVLDAAIGRVSSMESIEYESMVQICIWNSFHNCQITPTLRTPNAHYNLQLSLH